MKFIFQSAKTENIKHELMKIRTHLGQTRAKEDPQWKDHLINCALKRLNKVIEGLE